MLQKLLNRGCRITLGTDSMASNNNLSMLDEMKLCALSAKIQSNDPTAGSAADVFKIATRNGALAFGLDAGEIAATGGTSGVVYGVSDIPKADPLSRVNTFVHVNHTRENPRYGILLCINGTGIMNAWTRRNFAHGLDYDGINSLAASAPAGSDGVRVLPFGNGAERVLENNCTGARISGLDLNRHSLANVLRATQEGIAYSFRYGIDIMKGLGLKPDVIRAGRANMFLSPVFRQTLSTLTGSSVELYDTDGARGAARGAALGAGLYSSREECFASLEKLELVSPCSNDLQALEESYLAWKEELELALKSK